MDIRERIALLDWARITEDMHKKGYAAASNVLSGADCDELINQYCSGNLYRKTIIMEHHGYGLGEYKYFQYPLPALVQQLRECVYPKLAPIANNWMRVLNIDKQFPGSLSELLELCHVSGQ
ncbi:hypothetical protein MgSA37_04167 [Mucilaginibacter gotjawali]|uniref:Uncharacterized protein n=2 Tax=Mucilaginibacter gotjawali TaxID=1550579 RepID=A0A110B3W2_9SPHI|nr:2OG-Fe(II) oxygenase [Mucilaginibacter gotjawali]MBB3056895.1 hypothetical protein [Mucilaginibacter gotjawali]BAU55975.1 hypothetical protein MgSA37_04167 [Mucilaginibacter gotjawali]